MKCILTAVSEICLAARETLGLHVVKLLNRIARGLLRRSPFRALRHRLFLRFIRRHADIDYPQRARRVLVVGVYLATREHSAEHLAQAFAQVHPDIDVVQRWVAIGPASTRPELAKVTVLEVASVTPKFALVNRVFADIDIGDYDYVSWSTTTYTFPAISCRRSSPIRERSTSPWRNRRERGIATSTTRSHSAVRGFSPGARALSNADRWSRFAATRPASCFRSPIHSNCGDSTSSGPWRSSVGRSGWGHRRACGRSQPAN